MVVNVSFGESHNTIMIIEEIANLFRLIYALNKINKTYRLPEEKQLY